ncbi:hypothetical protein DVA78_20640 [Acinetobacter baumannii]|nr:hypothetical protein DVA78_20640 [Acinetobacter baumannii]
MEKHSGILTTRKRQTDRRECLKQPLNTANGRAQDILTRQDFFRRKITVHSPSSDSAVNPGKQQKYIL